MNRDQVTRLCTNGDLFVGYDLIGQCATWLAHNGYPQSEVFHFEMTCKRVIENVGEGPLSRLLRDIRTFDPHDRRSFGYMLYLIVQIAEGKKVKITYLRRRRSHPGQILALFLGYKHEGGIRSCLIERSLWRHTNLELPFKYEYHEDPGPYKRPGRCVFVFNSLQRAALIWVVQVTEKEIGRKINGTDWLFPRLVRKHVDFVQFKGLRARDMKGIAFPIDSQIEHQIRTLAHALDAQSPLPDHMMTTVLLPKEGPIMAPPLVPPIRWERVSLKDADDPSFLEPKIPDLHDIAHVTRTTTPPFNPNAIPFEPPTEGETEAFMARLRGEIGK